MKRKNVLILIPSRYNSSRFEGKPLALINGKSLVQRVYEGCESAKNISSKNFEMIIQTVVVTDDERIENHVKSFEGQVVRVDDDVASGTLRIERAYQKFFSNRVEHFDVIINVQGDEPLINGEDILRLAEFQLKSDYDISTIVKPELISNNELSNHDKVKAIYSKENGKCFFFSRAAVPFDRDQTSSDQNWFLHIGVYAYTPSSLARYCELDASYYEQIEKLEQLRALENNMSIGAIETDNIMIGIDRPEDITKLEGVLSDS